MYSCVWFWKPKINSWNIYTKFMTYIYTRVEVFLWLNYQQYNHKLSRGKGMIENNCEVFFHLIYMFKIYWNCYSILFKHFCKVSNFKNKLKIIFNFSAKSPSQPCVLPTTLLCSFHFLLVLYITISFYYSSSVKLILLGNKVARKQLHLIIQKNSIFDDFFNRFFTYFLFQLVFIF